MKKTSTLLPALLSILFFAGLFFSSCSSERNVTVEKRHYGKGYYVHVSGNHNETAVAENETTVPVNSQSSSFKQVNAVVASNGNTEQKTVSEKNNSSAFTQTISAFGEQNVSVKKQHSALARTETKKNSPVKSKIQKSISRLTDPKKSGEDSDISLILLVILAILLAPLAVLLKEGTTNRFWIDLICWLLGAGVVGFFFYGGGLLLFAIVFAILIVCDVI